jgi:hypothetical protein
VNERTHAEPVLDDETVERYARQIIVPGVGARGQARLLATTAAVLGHPAGVDAARAYLVAAGVRVVTAPFTAPADCVVLADTREREVLPCLADAPIAWYEIRGPFLAGGVATRDTLPHFSRDNAGPESLENPYTLVAHRVGASDAAGMAVAALLGWLAPGEQHDLRLDLLRGTRVLGDQ